MDTKVYESFEPFCKWQREETKDTLRVHLQGFRRDNIKVYAGCNKISIYGESELPMKGAPTILKPFHKEVQLPAKVDYELCNIQTKFEGGVFSIIVPKKVHKSATIADRLGLNKLVSWLNISERTAVEVVAAVSIGLALGVGAYTTYKLILPLLYHSQN